MKKYLQSLLLPCCWLIAMTGLHAQTPVANYTFSGNANDAAAGNNASVHGAKLTQDRFGWANNAFSFDGDQSYIEAPNSGALNSDYTTVAFWVNVKELPTQGEVFLMSFGGWQERWKISLPAHGKLVWTTNNSSGISDMDSGDGNEMVPGSWVHLAFIHDGTKDIIYKNGVQIAEKNVSGTMNSTSRPLGIGYNPIDLGNYFNGAMDEVRIYNVALSAGEIAALYADQNTAPSVGQQVVASYAFDNNTLDGSSFRNHARATDVTSVTDRFGFGNSAYNWNGTSSMITADNSVQLNSDYTTVSFWVRPNNLPASGEVFLMSFGGWQERWKISMPSHGKPVWTTNNSSGISDMDSGDGNEMEAGVWKHVVFVHDGTADKIFVNGVLANSKAVSGTLNSTTHPLGIGFNPIDGGNYFDGAIDDILIYNYALSDAEISDLHTAQSTFPGTAGDLVAEYKFAGDNTDSSPFGNHANVNGATLIADRFGWGANAYHFSGDASMWAANSPALNSDNATISFWIKVEELPASGEAFILSNGGWQERWKISLPNHGKLVFTTNNTSGISDMDSGGGNELPVGEWRHVVMTHDGTQDKIFINGVLANSKNVAGALNPTQYPLGIGYDPIGNSAFFNGDLDDIQIYNIALTDQEVADLYADQSVAPNITDELVADYPFSGNANDVTPYHNNAQVSGAQLGDDRFGRANKAYDFDGVSDYIEAANSPQLNSDYTTVSFWVNVEELPVSGEAFLMSFGGWQERWKISLPAHGKPVWTTNNSSGISDMDSGDNNALIPGTWTHLAFVHDGTKDIIYVNGTQAAEKNVAGTMNSTTHPLGMGYNPVDGGNYLNGSLDEVQIYNRALTAQEIADLYATQSQPPAITDTEAPDAPLNLTAGVIFNDVHLNWNASTDNVGVTGYNVYQDGEKIMTTTNTSADLLALTPLTTFTFGVTAVDDAGNESLPSTLDVTTGTDPTPDTTPPTAPGNLMASTGPHSVLLSWDPSVDDRQVAGYVVLVDGVHFDSLAGNAVSVLVGGLDAETFYTFEVYAFDLAGNDSDISEITVSTDEEIDTGEPGLVAWYPFDGNANDATPYANHGAIGGNPTFEAVTHPNGTGVQAIKFDGMQDSVLAPNAVQLISDYTTVSFWIRVDAVSTEAEAYVLDFGHWDGRWKISLPQHLKIVWTTNSKNSISDNFIHDMDSGDGNELITGFWWYVTMVHDGVNDIIYLDGEEVNNLPAAGILNSTNRPLGMGNNPIEGGQYFTGALDEVKIYNRALTPAEVERLFTEGGITDVFEPGGELASVISSVFPNPVASQLIVKHSFNDSQELLVRVLDAQGRQVDMLRYDKNELPSGQFLLNVHSYAGGTYFLNFVWGGKNLGSVKFDKR